MHGNIQKNLLKVLTKIERKQNIFLDGRKYVAKFLDNNGLKYLKILILYIGVHYKPRNVHFKNQVNRTNRTK